MVFRTALILISAVLTGCATHEPVRFVKFEPVATPPGWIRYCSKYRGLCEVDESPLWRVTSDPLWTVEK